MNIKKITIAMLGAALLAGCASLEERLASNDPEVKKDAERDLLIQQSYEFDANKRLAAVKRVTNEDVLASFAMSIPDPTSAKYQDRRPEALAALEKMADEKLLASVAAGATSGKIKAAAFDKIKTDSVRVAVKEARAKQAAAVREKMYKMIDVARDDESVRRAFNQIDFSQPGVGMGFLCSNRERSNKVIRAMRSGDRKVMARKIVAGLSDEEMLTIIAHKVQVNADYELDIALDERYANEGKSADMIAKKFVSVNFATANGTTAENEKLREAYRQRLMGMLNEITDEELVRRVLPKIDDAKGRETLFSKLSETNIVAIASDYGEKLDVCVDAARYVKNQAELVKVMRVLLYKLANEEQLKRYDGNKVKTTVAKFPKLSAEILATLMSDEKCHWKYLVDQVSSEMAYQLVAEGKVGCSSAEEAIAEKIDKESIDAKVYSKAKSLATKKSLLARMSEAEKNAVRELDGKPYALVLEKAKAAAKDTFELDGFYLGMTYDDMKVVFAHHFPDFEIVEDKDSNGAPLLFASGQRTPFCFVGKETGKVYEFNFGKKMVEKWYKYDVRNSLEWAMAFGRANNMKMELNSQTEKTSVYDSSTHRSYDAWLLQERYTHKDSKGYSLTYHGEFKINCGGPDIVAALIRGKAEKDFWHTGSDEGALKVKYAD